MAHVLSQNIKISNNFNPKLHSCQNGCAKIGEERWKNRRIIYGKEREIGNGKGLRVKCSTSSELGLVEKLEKNRRNLESLVSEFGWNVRRLGDGEMEMRRVAEIQAQAFHVPVALFNDLFLLFFQAEVLSGLVYKLRNSPPERYACLVAEPMRDACESSEDLVGVVDITVSNDKSILDHLQGVEEFLYVSGIAVWEKFRRKKIASVLLKGCDVICVLWRYEYLALRAYEDDLGARKLYENAGYKLVSSDPPWISTWIGRKRRVIFIKKVNMIRF